LSCYFSRTDAKLEVDQVQENSNHGVEGRPKRSSNDAAEHDGSGFENGTAEANSRPKGRSPSRTWFIG